uniref:Trafficking protein particle complex subunit n=1 Tax=Emiliania huxleyi TaxID=2903 RepID=A0A7S3T4P4_EMIHU
MSVSVSTLLPTRTARKRSEVVSQSAFAFLFSEMIQYSQTRVNTADELIAKLEDAGVGVGRRALELACWRERSSKRETRVRGILQFITQALWKSLFGAHADSLQKVQDSDDEFMIVEKEPLVNAFISSAPVNCAAFVAGGRTPSPPESGRLGRRLAVLTDRRGSRRARGGAVPSRGVRARQRGGGDRAAHQIRARGA